MADMRGSAALDSLLLDEISTFLDATCGDYGDGAQPDLPLDELEALTSLVPQWQLHPMPFAPSHEESSFQSNALMYYCGGSDSDGRGTVETQSSQSSDVMDVGEDEGEEHATQPLRFEKKKRPKPEQTMTRTQREKAKLAHLRLKASQLQLALDTLREVLRNKSRGQGHPTSLAAASVWGPLAKRQEKERGRAETENAELKKMVAAQVKFVKTLERKLRQRQAGDDSQSSKHHIFINVTPSEMKVFGQLLSSADTRLASFDRIFEAYNLNSTGSNNKRVSEAHAAYNDELGMHFNFVESTLMPFALQATADMLWKHMAAGEVAPPNATQKTQVIKQTENMLATVRVIVSKKTSCEAGHTTIYSVFKRVVYLDHVRLVWESFAESKQGLQSEIIPFIPLQLMHTGWTKVSRSHASDGSMAALIQSYARINPPLTKTSSTSQSTTKQNHLQRQDPSVFADLLMSSYQESVQSARQLIENELMDNFLKCRVSLGIVNRT